MRIILEESFLRSAKQLPLNVKKKLTFLVELLKSNPFHPRLRAKHLTGSLAGFLSFRITRDYRVIFRFADQQTIRLLKAGHRKDIYR